MPLYTVCFPDYPTARAAAEELGFWDTEADHLRTDGQGQNPDGSWFGWSIDEVGEVIGEPGYWVNVNGELPGGAGLDAYLRPYGSAGRVFAGTEPEDG